MDISLYIGDLLDEHEFVIVPGLGAFISSYMPAKYNDDKDILLPPSRSISFNPGLKINDGLLTRYIAQQQKITLTRASVLLEKFTGEVMVRLELGEEIVMGNFGTLTLKHGEFMFIPGISSRENSESFGLLPVAVTDYSSPSDKKDAKSRHEIREKRFFPWKWFGSLLLFFFIAVPAYFIFFTNHQAVIKPRPSVQKGIPDINSPENYISPDTTVYAPTETVPASKDSMIPHPGKELYYTIGGSFKLQQNADEYFNLMARKGFHPIHLGLRGDYYLVALDTFYTAKEAFEAADQHNLQFQDAGIWIYHPENKQKRTSSHISEKTRIKENNLFK